MKEEENDCTPFYTNSSVCRRLQTILQLFIYTYISLSQFHHSFFHLIHSNSNFNHQLYSYSIFNMVWPLPPYTLPSAPWFDFTIRSASLFCFEFHSLPGITTSVNMVLFFLVISVFFCLHFRRVFYTLVYLFFLSDSDSFLRLFEHFFSILFVTNTIQIRDGRFP